jgi:catechol 2,3-dioxygenase-like lactoylglutathione lyase family enzyme
MSDAVQFVDATPVLASLDIRRSVDFFVSKLGFKELYAVQGEYGVVRNGEVGIHFWACSDPKIPGATSCRVQVRNIDQLSQQCEAHGIVHPKGKLEAKPWGSREFSITDVDGNLVAFYEPAEVH